MHVRVFTLRFDPVTERFDDSAVVGFLADKEVLAINCSTCPTKATSTPCAN
ncbi:MAG TPA: hypothetical protein PK018_08845 [Candidatus Competibacter sp.]|nr:hypothetical protein [Gammaproteobacteria bacterium]HPE72263.1 hypothetical protein [Candidatus Competibacter sp.]